MAKKAAETSKAEFDKFTEEAGNLDTQKAELDERMMYLEEMKKNAKGNEEYMMYDAEYNAAMTEKTMVETNLIEANYKKEEFLLENERLEQKYQDDMAARVTGEDANGIRNEDGSMKV